MKYDKVKNEVIANIRDGDTIKNACLKSGISTETFQEWMRSKSDFSDAIKQAQAEHRKERAKLVEESLFKRATGYKTKEIKTELMSDSKGDPIIVRKYITEKEVAPDTGAAIFILTNSDPEKWKNRQSNELALDEKITGFRVEVVKSDGVPPIASDEEGVI